MSFDLHFIDPGLKIKMSREQLQTVEKNHCRECLLPGRLDIDGRNDVCSGGGDVFLPDVNIVNFESTPCFKIDGTPNAARNQAWTPIPAVMKLRFAGIHGYLCFGLIVVVECLQYKRRSFFFRYIFVKDIFKINRKTILFFTQELFTIHTPRAEHVVRAQNGRSV